MGSSVHVGYAAPRVPEKDRRNLVTKMVQQIERQLTETCVAVSPKQDVFATVEPPLLKKQTMVRN